MPFTLDFSCATPAPDDSSQRGLQLKNLDHHRAWKFPHNVTCILVKPYPSNGLRMMGVIITMGFVGWGSAPTQRLANPVASTRSNPCSSVCVCMCLCVLSVRVMTSKGAITRIGRSEENQRKVRTDAGGRSPRAGQRACYRQRLPAHHTDPPHPLRARARGGEGSGRCGCNWWLRPVRRPG